MKKSIKKRFWEKVNKKSKKECWNWMAGINSKKYGIFYSNKQTTAHRFSWELHNGLIPNNLFVCHKCDNKLCVNPKHLFLGTNQDNMNDKVKKGRQSFSIGETNGNVKLTEIQVIKIRKMYTSNKISQRKLAKIFKVTQATINYIILNKSWKHLTKELS